MTKTLTALIAAGTLATATAAVPTIAQERCIGCGIGGVEYPIAPPGYVCTIPPIMNRCRGPTAIGSACQPTTLAATWSAGAGVQRRSAPGYPAIVRGHCVDCASAAPRRRAASTKRIGSPADEHHAVRRAAASRLVLKRSGRPSRWSAISAVSIALTAWPRLRARTIVS